ncbi:hypothetical protein G2W53_021751 [Senna tora]|uniref:Uncharacterized protein n=1 Tax=Senna tora TaxID=362788 RepID=A0A834TLJ7_9FABA|nr:hypothetical protein G2W53_021751 [Senna tora]
MSLSGLESELMRLHNQRLLFTIKEETREELLESEDYEKSKVEIKGSVINPLFEPSSAEFRSSSSSSSPPPKFKFLRDAEEKLYRRMIEEEEAKKNKDLNNRYDSVRDYRDGSFLRLIKNKERIQFPSSSSSQVLPLASSPTTPPQINVNL